MTLLHRLASAANARAATSQVETVAILAQHKALTEEGGADKIIARGRQTGPKTEQRQSRRHSEMWIALSNRGGKGVYTRCAETEREFRQVAGQQHTQPSRLAGASYHGLKAGEAFARSTDVGTFRTVLGPVALASIPRGRSGRGGNFHFSINTARGCIKSRHDPTQMISSPAKRYPTSPNEEIEFRPLSAASTQGVMRLTTPISSIEMPAVDDIPIAMQRSSCRRVLRAHHRLYQEP